ncbi:hypothetical protein EUTSA_v10004535mg [Eutrema salsugineum]|uniref:LOB domain-containing protein n=1 Tax=Eutrema salsugineum TaxID=72664 RepID=V4K019_EUTSA|nr:LOB domain-containing protein 36 [Eutrema salsugineum]XP_024007088.1 LOB domain-containing protein 36 [Eutrema salsugineum]ESQ31170.1 hypothetical protein EUTSA_v10004535mg [Eutrema salsugineum]
MASSSSPCAACKFLRRKCTQECVFAPYFPPDQPQKFAYVHKVFGASNVAKLLNELAANHREDAVNSLFYEAEARLRDPVYGCVGLISILQHRLKQLQHDIENAKKELAAYVGPQAMLPILQPHQAQPHFMSLPPQPQRPSSSSSASVLTQQHHHNMLPMMAIPTGQLYHHQQQQQQQQIFEAQQLAAVAREQHNEMFRAYGGGGASSTSPHHHQNQPQVEILRFDNNGFDSVPTGSVTVTGFNQLSSGGTTVTGMSPSLALGGNFVDSPPTNDNYHADQQLHQHHHHHHQQQQHQHHEAQLFIPTQSSQPLPPQTQETHTQPNSETEEGRRNIIRSSR